MNLSDIAPRRTYNAYKKRVEDEHAVIFGMTRFGKSYLVERLLAMRKHVTIHDPKAEYDTPGFRRFEKLSDLLRATDSDAKVKKIPRTIYAPSAKEIRDEEAQSTYFQWVYARTNTVCVVDELNALMQSRNDMPEGMLDCYARGNARGVALWGLTQEPVYVANIAMTQARHRYCFFVALLPHQKKVCSVMPGLVPEAIDALPRRHFYYYEQGEKRAAGPFVVTGKILQTHQEPKAS